MSLRRLLSVLALAMPSLTMAASLDPIEASSVSEQTIVPQQISNELNRPIQVGVFVGVPSIIVHQKNEELHITAVKGKLKVMVSMFGRETPVELDALQVKQLNN